MADIKELVMDMANSNVRFSAIIYLPILQASNPEILEEFDDVLYPSDTFSRNYLLNQWRGLEQLEIEEDKEYFAYELSQQCPYPYMVKIDIAIPFNFKLNDDKSFNYCNTSWGEYYERYLFANSIEDAAEQALKMADEVFERELKKAQDEYV